MLYVLYVFIYFFCFFYIKDYTDRKLATNWDQYCIGLESAIEIYLLEDWVDTQTAFFARSKLIDENINLGKHYFIHNIQ